jgi:hypothetical protein
LVAANWLLREISDSIVACETLSRFRWEKVWLTHGNCALLARNASRSGSVVAPVSAFHRSLPPPLYTMVSLKLLAFCHATSLSTSVGSIRMSVVLTLGSTQPSPGVQFPDALHRLSGRKMSSTCTVK